MIHQDNLPPLHPGELLEDELTALDLSRREFAEQIGEPAGIIAALLGGEIPISPEMALLLGRYFGTGQAYWLNLQAYYDEKTGELR